MTGPGGAPLAGGELLPRSTGPLEALSGGELVELSELLYGRFFAFGLRAALVVATFSLLLSTLRGADADHSTPAVIALIVLALGVALREPDRWYWWLRRQPLRLAAGTGIMVAAFLIGQPDNNPLYYVGLSALSLLPLFASLRTGVAYSLLLGAAELLTYPLHGRAATLASNGLIVAAAAAGPLVVLLSAAVVERMAGLLLRLNAARAATASGSSGLAVENLSAPPRRQPSEPKLPLTARQLQVCLLLSQGLRYGEIAACLGITIRQVARLVAQARQRARSATTTELLAKLVAAGVAGGERNQWSARDVPTS
jgi:DNA-binding CsgD family transcriptional regulator